MQNGQFWVGWCDKFLSEHQLINLYSDMVDLFYPCLFIIFIFIFIILYFLISGHWLLRPIFMLTLCATKEQTLVVLETGSYNCDYVNYRCWKLNFDSTRHLGCPCGIMTLRWTRFFFISKISQKVTKKENDWENEELRILNGWESKNQAKKSQERSSPEFLSHPFGFFPSHTNCPWVSKFAS